MTLTLNYGDILAVSPTALDEVESVSKRFEEVKQFGATLLELCRELNAKMVRADSLHIMVLGDVCCS